MKPKIHLYRYGSDRQPREGLRIGAARQVPRGVRREDWQRRNYFDLRIPLVAPTPALFVAYRHSKISFAVFSRRYRREMQATESQQAIELLAALSLSQPISIGCFCEDETRCHRSLLKELIVKEAKKSAATLSRLWKASSPAVSGRSASPVCFAGEHE